MISEQSGKSALGEDTLHMCFNEVGYIQWFVKIKMYSKYLRNTQIHILHYHPFSSLIGSGAAEE